MMSLLILAACGELPSAPSERDVKAEVSRNFYACETGWIDNGDGSFGCTTGVTECDGSAAAYFGGCSEQEIALCDDTNPFGFCGGSGSGVCFQYSVTTSTCGSGSGGADGGGTSGGNIPPVEDSVSYEEVVAATDSIMQQIDDHIAEWNSPPVALMGEPPSASAQMLVTPETALDLLVLGYDVSQLVTAGPSAGRLAAVLADLGATIIPGLPAPGSLKILAQGAKESKAVFQHTKRLLQAARIGRAFHAEKSAYLWSHGHIGATRIFFGGKIKFVDGAYINRAQRTITLVEFKPATTEAIAMGRRQLTDYVEALSQMESWKVYNKFDNLTETFFLQGPNKWTILKDDVIQTYAVQYN